MVQEKLGRMKPKKSALARKKTWKDAIFYAVITCVPIIQFCVFYVGVNFNSVLMSFQEYDKVENIFLWNGLNNYKQFFFELTADGIWKIAFVNSTIALLIGLFVTKTLALVFAYYMYKKRLGYKAFRIILFIPSIISSLVTVAVFSQFVDGAIPSILTKLVGLPMQGLLANEKSEFATIVFYNVWVAFGPSLLMYSSAMNGISPSVSEAAEIDGCGPFREFISVVFPMIWDTYVVFFIATLSTYFSNSLNLYSFYGSWSDRRLYTFGYYLFRNAEVYKVTMTGYPYLSAIGVCFTILLVPVVLGARKLMFRFGPRTE